MNEFYSYIVLFYDVYFLPDVLKWALLPIVALFGGLGESVVPIAT